jgi:uncharacterized coiled-coil DUF342 family protein
MEFYLTKQENHNIIKTCEYTKEKKMTTKTSNNTTTKLKEQITAHSNNLDLLRNRVNELVDELHSVKAELNNFKKNVASDVKYLTNKVDA